MIKEHVEMIQKLLKEKYGVEANIDIMIHTDKAGNYLSKGQANEIVKDLSFDLGSGYENWMYKETAGVSINDYSKRVRLSAYYPIEQYVKDVIS